MTFNAVARAVLYVWAGCWIALGIYWVGGKLYFAYKDRQLNKRINWLLSEIDRR